MNFLMSEAKHVRAASVITLLDGLDLRAYADTHACLMTVFCVCMCVSAAHFSNRSHRKKKWNNRTFLKVYMKFEERKK